MSATYACMCVPNGSLKVVDNFSSKLDLPREIETVETIDANHMAMVRYPSKEDAGYKAVSGVLKNFIRKDLPKLKPIPALEPCT
jgi:hypothetical protein